MPSSARFTTSFQKGVAAEIELLLNGWFGDSHGLEVGVETKPVSSWRGQPDVWIWRLPTGASPRPERILNIEIEHWSCAAQAKRNVEHVVTWVRENRGRRATVLHLIHSNARISDNACTDLFSYGIDNRSRRFTYDFRVYDVGDGRASRSLAVDFTDGYGFQSVVWQHLRFLRLLP